MKNWLCGSLLAALLAGVPLASAIAQTTATADGDSVTTSYGVPSGSGWVALLATATGKTIANGGILNAQAADLYPSVYAHTWATDAFVTLMIGDNDQRTYGTDAAKFGFYKSAVAAEVYFLAQTTVNASTLSHTGTWASNLPYTAGIASHAPAGSSLTGSFTGSTLTVGYVLVPATSSGKFSVAVEGAVVATVDCNAPFTMTTQLGAAWGPQLLRIPGFSAGSHTVVFTKLDANSVYIDWIGQGSNSKPVYLLSITRFNATGYAPAPVGIGGSDQTVAAYESFLSALTSLAQGDGFNVIPVNMEAIVDPLANLQADGVHPNAAIQPAMRDAMLAAINGTAPAPVTSVDSYLNWQRW